MSLLELNKLKASERKIKLFDITRGFDKYIIIDLINETYNEIFEMLLNNYEVEEVDFSKGIYLNSFHFREIIYFDYTDTFKVEFNQVAFKIEPNERDNVDKLFKVIDDLEKVLLDKHLNIEERKIYNECFYLDEKKQLITYKKLNWKGSITDIVELSKSMFESGKIKNTQKEITESFSLLFQTEIKYPHKLLQDIKERSNGNETILLDKLKSSLNEYLQK